MRVTRKTNTKPSRTKERWSLTELTPAEFETIRQALELMPENVTAAAMLKTFTDLESAPDFDEKRSAELAADFERLERMLKD